MSFLHTFFGGNQNKRMVKHFGPTVEKINAFESALQTLSDDALKHKTVEFRERLAKGETLDDMLPEAFAVVREASRRTTGMRHYDVQMIGGIALHQGKIAEMRTGEGKTLVATLPVYLNALEGEGVHLVTVNDYLAKRDAVWMGKIYDFLGLTVGIVQNQRVSFVYDAKNTQALQHSSTVAQTESTVSLLSEEDKKREDLESFKVENEYLRTASRQEAYRCDITYGTNNEFGFDYLRDNMVQDLNDMVMRPGSEMHYAIVDEVDSILIDEARTPLIISAPAEEATEQYYQFAKWVTELKENQDYNVDEKMRSVTLTEGGIAKFEKWLGVENIYVEGGMQVVHHIEQALKAEILFKRDKDYIVEQNGEVVIIDEFTGRKMPGRRYSEGLHQAIEAKERVPIQRESRTLATITFQNLFRMYDKLAGMTGTASTEADEFYKIYGLDVLTVPTNKLDCRNDLPDRIYKTEEAKNRAIVEKIKECTSKGQPILVGTISVEKNEELSQYLHINGIPHEILNAKNHEREGEIIAQAGRPGAVTLATNMAGRGVDIKLGGVPADPADTQKVVNAGGLFVLGTERHESRRIDNQLRGRSARQGDPGQTQFFVSTDDDLMRIFAGDRLKGVMTRLNVPDDMPIEQRMITRMLEGAQKKVEAHHYDMRKHLLEYDDVLNRQRDVIYKKRRMVLDLAHRELESSNGVVTVVEEDTPISPDVEVDEQKPEEKIYHSLRDMVLDMIEQEIELVVSFHTGSEDIKEWNTHEIYETVRTMFALQPSDRDEIVKHTTMAEADTSEIDVRNRLTNFLLAKARHEYEQLISHVESQAKDPAEGKKMAIFLEKGIVLRTIDMLWVDYLVAIDYLRTGIGLQGYGQRDPLVEYKRESWRFFNELLSNIQKDVVYTIFKVQTGIQLAPSIMADDKLTLKGAQKTSSGEAGIVEGKLRDDSGHKVGRNDSCPCGSGKKYKKCHGK